MMHDFVQAPWIDLTSRQRSIWLDVSASGDGRLFQVGASARISQRLDLELLQRALGDVIRRHDGLRLVIDPDQPRQRIERTLNVAIQVVDFSTASDPDTAGLAYIDQLFASPFALAEKSLVQFFVLQLSADSCYLVLRVHHIVTDAIAFSLAFKDIIRTYNCLKSGDSAQRPRSSYRKFQEQDAAFAASPRSKRDLEYWQKRLHNPPKPLFAKRAHEDLAVSRPVLRQEIERSRYERFLSQCADQAIRPGNAILGLAAWLLARARGCDELIIGVAYPGRAKEDQVTVGIFSGVIPLRVKIPDSCTLPDLAAAITQSLSRDYLHYRTPIDDIRRNLSADQRHRGTLIDAMVSFIPIDVVDFDCTLGDERLRVVPLRGKEANPLAIYVSEVHRDQPATLEFGYDPKFLGNEQVSVLADRFGRLFDSFIECPHAPMQGIDLLADDPRDDVEATGNLIQPSLAGPSQELRIISTFTSEPVTAPLQFWLQRTGLESSVTFAGYNQVFQELLDPTSEARRNRRGANVILLRIQDWLRERETGHDPEADTQFLMKVADDFVAALRQAAQASHVPLLLLVCPPSPEWDAAGPRALLHDILLEKLRASLSGTPNLDVTTYRTLRELYPTDAEYDATGDQLGHLPYTTGAFTAIATLVARRVHLLLRSPIKVIAVDCDNTLWDGVVGEDGADGIKISDHHRLLQSKLVEAAKCGVLICLCSKNLESDVTAVFQNRPDMVLKPEHIVGYKVNWGPKSENIRQLAKELNLGLDSFLFLDDNPVEIAEVASACPQVTGVLVRTTEPEATRFDHLWPLDCLHVTAEDAKRVESYRHNLSRIRERENASDFSSFIAGLDLRIHVDGPNDENLARLAQLTERTNQFNINNVKRSGAALTEQNAVERSAVRAVHVSDKFGDYGIVGLFAVRMDDRELLVDTFLMSCRVLGRGVEHRMISEIGRLALQYSASIIKIPVRVTDRNLPVRRFLESIEGQHLDQAENQLHILSADVAAQCCFRPMDQAESVEDGDETPVSAKHAGRRDAAVWIETAALTSIPEIERAVQAATVAERRPTNISRKTETPTEQILAGIFAQALGLEAIGADDDFFDLGVHSLMAVQVVSRIRDRFDCQLSIRALFECSTIAKLAEAIDRQSSAGYQPLVPLQIGDEAPALFCCHPANGDAVCYMRLTKALGLDQSVYGLEASGLSPGELMASSVEEMASAYVKEMISAQPRGPYHLLGWSFGGALAFEIARQIHDAGREIGFLGFMDAVAPEKGEIPPLPFKVRAESELTAENEAKLLEGVAAQIDTMRRYAKLPPRINPEAPLSWQEAIEGFQSMGIVPDGYSIDEMRRKMLVYSNCGLVFTQYRPPAIPVPVVHFRASQNHKEWDFDWSPYTTQGVRTVWIRCNHFRMGFEPNTNVIAAHLRAFIRGDKSALGWWRRASFARSVEGLMGRLAFQRG